MTKATLRFRLTTRFKSGFISAVGRDARRRRRSSLGCKHSVQVSACISMVRLEPKRFPELPDRVIGAALPVKGSAQVAVGVGESRVQADE
jgi:hypothetical protein